jgi:hypothetical protein
LLPLQRGYEMKAPYLATDAMLNEWENEEQEEFIFIQRVTGKKALITAANIEHAAIKLQEQFDDVSPWYWEV